jgi:hypothetical protein
MLGNSATLGGGSPISSGAAFESATLPGYMPVSATSETGNLVAGGASQNIIGDAAQAAGGSLGSTTSDLGLGVTPTSAGAPSAATAAPVSTSAPATGATAPVSGATAPVSSDVVADTNLAGGDYGGGGDKPASFIDKALKYVENNPLSVAGAGITGLQMLMGNGTPPAQKQLTAMAGENMHNAQAMEAYLTAGKLPAGMQMGVDRALKGQEATIKSNMSRMGLSGSTMEAQAIAGAKESSQVQAAQIAMGLFKQGVDLSRLASGEWETILKAELEQDQAFNQALGRFASGLAGARSNTASA